MAAGALLLLPGACAGPALAAQTGAAMPPSAPQAARPAAQPSAQLTAQPSAPGSAPLSATLAATLSATPDEPRAFGHFVGDRLQRRVQLQWPAGLAPDLASLPMPRRPGQVMELRAARLDGRTLVLDYQIWRAPPQVQTFEIAPLQLRLAGPAGEHWLRIEAWPVTVAPLLPLDVSPRTGLGALRPDLGPPAIPTAARRGRLLLLGAALLLVVLVLLQLQLGLPWWGRRQRPFARAWRALRPLPAQATPVQWQAALARMHRALDTSAGQVLFASGLPAFVARQPGLAPLQAMLAQFFQRSDAAFFGAGGTPDMPWLQALCRACRDAERQAGWRAVPGHLPRPGHQPRAPGGVPHADHL